MRIAQVSNEPQAAQRPGASEGPPDMAAAIQFISMCSENYRPIVLTEDEDDEGRAKLRVIQVDMPMMQEKAFNMACLAVGLYFKRMAYQEYGIDTDSTEESDE